MRYAPRRLAPLALLAGLGLLAAGCGSGGSGSSSGSYGSSAYGSSTHGPGWEASGSSALTVPLDTSLVTAQGTWAITVMGGSAASENNFWQLFVRPSAGSHWSLVTPPGVADNGGLVAAGTTKSLLIGFRPSQALTFSPLAASANAGQKWTTGLLNAHLANVPDALAEDTSGRALALLQDGTVETAPTAAAAAGGQWSRLATLAQLKASAAARSCGLGEVNAVSFGRNGDPVIAGTCSRPGAIGLLTETGGQWQAAGLTLPASYGAEPTQVLGLAAGSGGDTALLLAGDSLLAAWQSGTRWTVSGPTAVSSVRAAGFGAGWSAWLLLATSRGGTDRAETISGPGGSWRALPAVPAGTATLAPASGGGYQALAVSGAKLTVWQLTGSAWARTQLINVPIEYGSSS